jgi:hypothetical protein
MKYTECTYSNRVSASMKIHYTSCSTHIEMNICNINIRHSASPIEKCLSLYIASQRVMDDEILGITHELEFFCSISFECPELLQMIGCNLSQDGNIWYNNRSEKIHLSRMINSVLEDEVFWIATKKSRQSNYKNPYPENWIFSTSSSSDDGERESIFTIVVIF